MHHASLAVFVNYSHPWVACSTDQVIFPINTGLAINARQQPVGNGVRIWFKSVEGDQVRELLAITIVSIARSEIDLQLFRSED